MASADWKVVARTNSGPVEAEFHDKGAALLWGEERRINGAKPVQVFYRERERWILFTEIRLTA